jgi:signal transduction histidine kinase/CheY-like chemotaxis protein
MTLGALVLKDASGASIAYRADGAALHLPSADSRCVIIRLTPRRESIAAFVSLNERFAASRHAQHELREADRRKDEFLAILAHELRNPLAPIRNAMQIMQIAEGDVATVSAARVIVERQLKHLTRLIDDLLDLSRITQGKIELRRESADLTSLIKMALEIARPQLEGKQHPLQISLASEGLYLKADPNRVAQVFANLLHNASKYSAAGAPIRIEGRAEGEEVVVRIIDQGIGIPADMTERIFDLFAQVDRPGNGSYDGLGIGLTLVKRLVELHNGSVVAQSDGPRLGSCFTVRLPRVRGLDRADAREPAARVRGSESGLRILVADDNRDAAQTLALMLRLEGHEVRAVHDGAEALVAGETFHPQLVLLDIGMPGLNGYETARQIRKRPWGEHTHLVALTGWGQEADRSKALEAGFEQHLVKPAEPEALQTVIDRLVAGPPPA